LSDKKTYQLNIRLDHENFTLLNQISKDVRQSPSTVGSQIISQWIEFYYYKIYRGDIIVSQPILRKFFDIVDDKSNSIEAVAGFAADYIIKEIKIQKGQITYPVLVDHILKWNKGNHLLLNRIEQEGVSDVFISRHNLGRNWSALQCQTYTKAFEIIGQTVISAEYDQEDTFTFEVVQRKNNNQ